jgi:hypothetical protein
MPFPCHAVPLRVYIVSFPFDLHSAAVLDSHMPCRSHAAPVPCHDHAVVKATSQGHSTSRHGHGMCELASAVQRRDVGGRPARFRLLPATTRSSTKVVIRSTPIRYTVGLAVRIFPTITRTFTKDTALWENGMSAAWERHGMCKLALSVPRSFNLPPYRRTMNTKVARSSEASVSIYQDCPCVPSHYSAPWSSWHDMKLPLRDLQIYLISRGM